RLIRELLDGIVEPPGVRVVDRDVRLPRSAEQLPQRQFRRLGIDVPERDVDGGLRHRRGSGASDPVRLAEVELCPDFADVARVLARKIVDEQAVERLLDYGAA